MHVGNTVTLPCFFDSSTVARFLNQVLKRSLANGGRSRTVETPVVILMSLRTMDPGCALTRRCERAGIANATVPNKLVWPRTDVVMRLRKVT